MSGVQRIRTIRTPRRRARRRRFDHPEWQRDVIDLTIRTTLDRNAQIAADRAVRTQAAAIQSKRVVALSYRVRWWESIRAMETSVRLQVDDSTSAETSTCAARASSAGSAFKPFVYAAAMAAGYTPSSEVDDDPST